jgi:hypothetical protein
MLALAWTHKYRRTPNWRQSCCGRYYWPEWVIKSQGRCRTVKSKSLRITSNSNLRIGVRTWFFMHSGSVLRKSQPDFVCYQEAYETQHEAGRRMFIRGITAVVPEWLFKFVPKLCNIGPLLIMKSCPNSFFHRLCLTTRITK